MNNSSPKRTFAFPDTDIFGEPNAAEKFKISKKPIAVVFESKISREQRCVLLKTKKKKKYIEKFSSKNTDIFGEPAEKSKVSKKNQCCFFLKVKHSGNNAA